MAAYADLGTIAQVAPALPPERLFRMEGSASGPWAHQPERRRAWSRLMRNGPACRRAAPKERGRAYVMLVDLERNDLGRVCEEPGSVKVSKYRSVESYSHVHHLVSRVSEPAAREVASAFRSFWQPAFPGGSTSLGAPKIRCQEIIHGLERQALAVRTAGSLGWWGPRAAARGPEPSSSAASSSR